MKDISKRDKELKKAVEPLMRFLFKYGDPHTSANVTMHYAKITQDVLGVPNDNIIDLGDDYCSINKKLV